jgi:hypothetical protein
MTLALTLALFSGVTSSAGEQRTCPAVMLKTDPVARVLSERERPLLDSILSLKTGVTLDNFKSRKAQFLSLLEAKQNLAPETLKTPTDRMAFLEAYGEFTNQDFFSWMKNADPSVKKTRQYFKLMTALDFSKPIADYMMRDFLWDIWEVSNPPPKFWKKIVSLKTYIGPGAKELVERRLMIEAMHGDLIGLLRNSGLVRNQNLLERAGLRKYTLQLPLKLIGTAASNAVTIVLFHWPSLIPRTNFSKTQSVASINRSALIDVFTTRLRNSMLATIVGLTVFNVAHSNVNVWKLYQDSAAMVQLVDGGVKEDLNPNQKRISDADLRETMSGDLYKFWSTHIYYPAQGHMPDPLNSNLDKLKWLSYVDSLSATPNASQPSPSGPPASPDDALKPDS